MKKGTIRQDEYKKKYKEYKLFIENEKQKQEIKEKNQIDDIEMSQISGHD